MARVLSCRLPLLTKGSLEMASVTDYLTHMDQKIPDWFLKITLLVKVKTATRSGVKSRFGIMGCSTSDAILGLWFSL